MTATTKLVTVAGVVVAVAPVKVRDLPAFLTAIEPMLGSIGLLGGSGAAGVLALLAVHGQRMIEATALGAGVEEAWLGEQTPDVLVDLVVAVVEVNIDFFVRVLLPKVTAATQEMTELGGGMGGLAA